MGGREQDARGEVRSTIGPSTTFRMILLHWGPRPSGRAKSTGPHRRSGGWGQDIIPVKFKIKVIKFQDQ